MSTPSVHQPSESTHTAGQRAANAENVTVLMSVPSSSCEPVSSLSLKSLPYDLASPSDAHSVAQGQKPGYGNPESRWDLCILPPKICCFEGVDLPFTRYLGKALSLSLVGHDVAGKENETHKPIATFQTLHVEKPKSDSREVEYALRDKDFFSFQLFSRSINLDTSSPERTAYNKGNLNGLWTPP